MAVLVTNLSANVINIPNDIGGGSLGSHAHIVIDLPYVTVETSLTTAGLIDEVALKTVASSVPSHTFLTRPDPATVPIGQMIYISNTKGIQWSDGIAWRDLGVSIVFPNGVLSVPDISNGQTVNVGDVITIYGSGFIQTVNTTVDVSNVQAQFAIVSSQEIQVTIPVGAAGQNQIGVFFNNCLLGNGSFGKFNVASPPPPALTSSTPASPATVEVGAVISVFGTNILTDFSSTVTLGGHIAFFNTISSAQLNVHVPNASLNDTGDQIQLNGTFGSSNLFGSFDVIAPPPTAYQQLCIDDGAALIYPLSEPTWVNDQTVANRANLASPVTLQVISDGSVLANFGLVTGDNNAIEGFDDFNNYIQGSGAYTITPGADFTVEFVFQFFTDPASTSTAPISNDVVLGEMGWLENVGSIVYRFNPKMNGTPADILSSNTTLSTFTRYHIHLVWRAGTAEIWINGVLDASSNTVSAPTASNIALYWGFGKTWDADINELDFYPLALSSGQIAAHYTAAGGV